MKKEEGILINLPDGAEYRGVQVTDDGILIIYAIETNVETDVDTGIETGVDTIKVSTVLPKPEPLIGGTEVYQKKGIPYWYCKIKDRRDEFMHLYFGDLTEDDLLYTPYGEKRNFATKEQKKFKADVVKALQSMPEEGFRWIPVYEPSINNKGNLQYVSRRKVLRNLSCDNWEEIFKNYSPKNESRMATITTYFLLLLRLLKDGYATIEQLANDSKEIGHYCDSKNAKHKFEKTGERKLGGLYGFAGNTYKIVKDSNSWSVFCLLGGYCKNRGNKRPLAEIMYFNIRDYKLANATGLMELTK